MLSERKNLKYTYKKEQIASGIFQISFIIFIIQSFLDVSMFVYSIPSIFIRTMLLISMLGFIIKIIVFDRHTYLEIMLIMLWLLLTIFIFYKTRYYQPLVYSVVVLACKNNEFSQLNKIHFLINLCLLIFVTILSQTGVLQDLVFYRDGVGRHSLGMLYATNYSARVFFLGTSYLYLRKFRISFFEMLLISGISFIVFQYTGGRLDSVLLVFVVILAYMSKLINRKLLKFLSFIGCFVPFISLLFSYVTAKFYNPMSITHYEINRLFSWRLGFGYQALEMYDILPFGQSIYIRGNGGLQGLNNLVNQYFFIDSSYLDFLIRFGWIFTISVIIILTIVLVKIHHSEQYMLVLLIGVICVNSIVATYLISVPVNVFILILFSRYKRNRAN